MQDMSVPGEALLHPTVLLLFSGIPTPTNLALNKDVYQSSTYQIIPRPTASKWWMEIGIQIFFMVAAATHGRNMNRFGSWIWVKFTELAMLSSRIEDTAHTNVSQI